LRNVQPSPSRCASATEAAHHRGAASPPDWHHAIAAVLEPIHERRMIADNYACRRHRGTHAALRRATAWARTYRWWVRLDVEQFFPSIDHAIVREHLTRDLPSQALRDVCERILAAGATRGSRHFDGDDLFSPLSRSVGLPLGSLTSQLWANRYLDPVDHVVKDRFRTAPTSATCTTCCSSATIGRRWRRRLAA
jgi:hypothetical protein